MKGVCSNCEEEIDVSLSKIISQHGTTYFVLGGRGRFDRRAHTVVTEKEKPIKKIEVTEPVVVVEEEFPAAARMRRLLAKQEARKKQEEESNG
jgi:hypothetical protein